MAFIDLISGLKILKEVENNTENYEREIIDLQYAKTRIQNAVSATYQNEAKIAFIKVKVELLKRKLEPQAVEVFLLPWILDNYLYFKANRLCFDTSILYLETSILISFYHNKKSSHTLPKLLIQFLLGLKLLKIFSENGLCIIFRGYGGHRDRVIKFIINWYKCLRILLGYMNPEMLHGFLYLWFWENFLRKMKIKI